MSGSDLHVTCKLVEQDFFLIMKKAASPDKKRIQSAKALSGEFKRVKYFYCLYAILCIALIARIIFLVQFSATPFFSHPLIDAKYYDNTAREIASGNIIQDRAFFMGPLYSYCLGAIYAVSDCNRYAPSIIQMLLGIGVSFLLFLLGRRLFSPAAGLFAALIYALYKPVLFFEQTLLMETPLAFLSLLLLFVIIEKGKKNISAWWLLIGVIAGTAALFRGNMLLFIPVLAMWIVINDHDALRKKVTRDTLFNILFLFLGTAVAIFPATLHNFIAEKEFILISSNLGVNLYIGNNKKATGCFEPLPGLDQVMDMRGSAPAKAALGRDDLKSSEMSSYWRSLAFDYIGKYPMDFVKLLFLKLYFFWGSVELEQILAIQNMKVLMPVLKWPLGNFFILGPLALSGLLMGIMRKKKEVLLIAFFLFTYIFSLLPFFMTDRYRIPAIPVLCLFSGCSIATFVQMLKGKKWKHLTIYLSAIFFLMLILNNSRFLEKRQNTAVFHNSLGLFHLKERKYEQATAEFKSALIHDSAPKIYYNLGRAYYFSKHYEDSSSNLLRFLEYEPDHSWANFLLADSFFMQDKKNSAIKYYEKAASLQPGVFPVLYCKLAFLYLKKGEKERASKNMKEYIRLEPDKKDAVKAFIKLGGSVE
jgi:tetratricopeptide (TPR) repeat protein